MSNERSALKVTSARFFRPNGANLERYLGGRLADADAWGVKPDPDLDRPIYREDSMKLQADLWRRQVLQEPDPPVSDPQIEQALQSLRASLAR